MPSETFTFKDLSSKQLEKLKDNYITSKINAMSVDDLKDFVCTIITDQVKGTVGNQEEREAWKEMNEFYRDSFVEIVLDIKKKSLGSDNNNLSLEEIEYSRRLKMLEIQKESETKNDMW